MRWLIVGANGILGREIQRVLQVNSVEHLATSKHDLDINNNFQMEKMFSNFLPTHIVNCAGLTDVDICERYPDKAFHLNYHGVMNLGQWCKKFDGKLIQISTNFVFDGKSERPYQVLDIKNPINVYGLSKSFAEDYCISESQLDAQIIRTASLYSQFGRNFTRFMINSLQLNKPVKVITNLCVQPTWAFAVATQVYNLAASNNKHKIIHCASGGTTSWFEFSTYICKVLNLNQNLLIPVEVNNLNFVAKRPNNAILSSEIDKIQPIYMADWQSMLTCALTDIVN